MRDGAPCEDCIGKSRWPGIFHRCYRGSALGSACVGLIGPRLKKLIRRYPRSITLIALTNFAKSRYVADEFSTENIIVRGNCLADPGIGLPTRDKRIVYVGRLSPEKGVETLLHAAKTLDGELEIIGDGPDRQRLEAINDGKAKFLGALHPAQVFARIKTATALAVPSRSYEGFPMVVLEAMATGTPVIASKIGSLAEIVRDGETGILVDPLNVEAWNKGLSFLLSDSEVAQRFGSSARQLYLRNYCEEKGTRSLAQIYQEAKNKLLVNTEKI